MENFARKAIGAYMIVLPILALAYFISPEFALFIHDQWRNFIFALGVIALALLVGLTLFLYYVVCDELADKYKNKVFFLRWYFIYSLSPKHADFWVLERQVQENPYKKRWDGRILYWLVKRKYKQVLAYRESKTFNS